MCLAAALPAPVVAVAAGGESGGATGTDRGSAFAQVDTPTPTNNSTVRHEDPATVEGEGNTSAVRAYLLGQLAQRLAESSVEIERGRYEAARGTLGDDYEELLGMYVEVAGSDGGSATSLERAREQQREYAATLATFNDTYEAYRTAKREGNEDRARELARRLTSQSDRLNRTEGNLTSAYGTLANTTGADLDDATENIENASESVSERRSEVVAESFVTTRLSVRTDAPSAAFDDPLTLTGRLRTANGSAVSNRLIAVSVGERTLSARTNATGVFEVDYRPVGVAVGAERLSIAYLPNDDSVYLGSNDSVPVSLSGTNATVTVEATPERVAYGDSVVVNGTATAEGTPVSDATVRVSVDGRVVGVAETGPNGSYSSTFTLPASVPTGEAAVSAVVGRPDSAVRSAVVRDGIVVERTPIGLSMNATPQTDASIVVRGTVETADGLPVSNGSVDVSVDGRLLASVDVAANGTFRRVVAVDAAGDDPRTVRVEFDGGTTSLGTASASESVRLGSTGRAVSPGAILPSVPGGVAVGVALLATVGLAVIFRRRRNTSTTATNAAAAAVPDDSPATESGPTEPDPLETAARQHRDGEYRAAVETAYRAVRTAVADVDGVGVPAAGTHWEAYTAAADGLSTEEASLFRRVTEAYERAVYADARVSDATVGSVLEDCALLRDELAGSDGATAASGGPGASDD